MEKKHESRRIRYTKAVIRQALLDMLKEKSINKITVKELCEAADVNRGTFYSYYRDAYDLLDRIETDLYTDITQALTVHEPAEVIGEIFRLIEENEDLCSVLFSENGDPSFLNKVMSSAEDVCVESWKKKMQTEDEALLKYLYTFASAGSVAIIQNWLRKKNREPVEQTAGLISRVTYGGLNSFEKGGQGK